jgi:NAD dependent epimerase/dehydratase
LAERLSREEARVRAFVQYNSSGSFGWLDHTAEDLREAIQVIPGDVRDAEQVSEIVGDCEVVFHLAALISVPYSIQAPESFIDTNVIGTLNVLQAARAQGNVKVVQTSSSEVYGTSTTVPITESHPLRAQSPYAASKIASDKLAESFYHSYGLPVVILRPFNTYGPRQSTRAVLPVILSQLLAGLDEIHLGALSPRRDLTFVDDTVDGFLRAGETGDAVGQTVHLGTGRDISIGELAELAARVLGKEVSVVSEEERLRPTQSEVTRLLSDPSLARDLLRWSAATRLEDGIARTAAWMEERIDDYRVGEYQT